MSSFVATDDRGSFVLDGAPWFLHGATYFGRRPERVRDAVERLGQPVLHLWLQLPHLVLGLTARKSCAMPGAHVADQARYWASPASVGCAPSVPQKASTIWSGVLNLYSPYSSTLPTLATRRFR